MPNTISYNEDKEKEITDLLLGHKVEYALVFPTGSWGDTQGVFILDNGVQVFVVPNRGGCSCGAGDYDLTSLNRVDNLITRVDFIRPSEEDLEMERHTAYRIFVLAGHEKINLLSIEGSDGNGYYGTGYELIIRFPGSD